MGSQHDLDQKRKEDQKHIVAGILAHVDAGKTTLTESLLYTSGTIRTAGRVDNGDAFLDTHALERARGITIFSKQAEMTWGNMRLTLLDTPGHVDFSAETERTLGVLDYAVLVISGADGVQGHTKTLWELLKRYNIPAFLFVNKMDQPGTDRERLMAALKEGLDGSCVDFSDVSSAVCQEEIAACDEEAMETFFTSGRVPDERIRHMIWKRELFPCFFGSALKGSGIAEFLDGLDQYTIQKVYPDEFGARVYKITRDPKGVRLTHLKITGGSLKVRDTLFEEKVSQIRIYNGEKFDAPQEVPAGEVCAVAGPKRTYPGQGFGFESEGAAPVLEPVLSRQILLPEETDAGSMLPKLRMLEEEQPELALIWDERLQEIRVQVMGEVQIEILQSLIEERFGVRVDFGPPHILYKETIAEPVEGVGHFEPLRHYAEVHLLLEPLPPGSGLVFAADCSEDVLDKNWQRLILTHLEERTHRGVLTGSPVTDLKITVIAGRAHPKHTVGGDFRQATYRAVRQGLMETESRLLEPYYNFRLEIPESAVGRAMTDIEQMNGHFDPPVTEGDHTVLTGYAPVSCMQDYKREVSAYTKGFGRLSFSLRGYEACHNEDEVIAARGYDPEADTYHTPDSVFCANGSGYIVPWDEVKDCMHVESPLTSEHLSLEEEAEAAKVKTRSVSERWLGTEEVDAILAQATQANRGEKGSGRSGVVKLSRGGKDESAGDPGRQKSIEAVTRTFGTDKPREEYLLVDGYNVIYAWEELAELAGDNMDAARGKLLDELCNYQGIRGMNLIAVFDAYRVKDHQTEALNYHNIHVVFTKEAETADQYIEKFAHTHAKHSDVTVATSDGLEQIIIRGEGCRLLSARDLIYEIKKLKKELAEEYKDPAPMGGSGEMLLAVEEALKEKKQEED
ncbi:MAG: TetM/TetW/TetO/TetS family tetracycline resistance ribosomal protection protein [Lachnospiraceae bacterium]|nr:TetM/TetW/TetO/TetS family tetracycline resistance ribosomal protection protein [Lachnospiraceae bacterium]